VHARTDRAEDPMLRSHGRYDYSGMAERAD
jgi:hypothetical protein